MYRSDHCLVTGERADGKPIVSERLPDVSVPGGAFINGVWQRDDLTLPVTDPEDGRLLGFVADSSPADVAAAVSAVQDSISTEDWPLWARSECLHRAARLLEQEATRFVTLIASEGVKTLSEAEREVARCVETLRLSAEAGVHLEGSHHPVRSQQERAEQGRLVHSRTRRRRCGAHLLQRPAQPRRAQTRPSPDRGQRRRPETLRPHPPHSVGAR